MTPFNEEALLIDEADDKVLVTTFTNGLKSGKFLFSIYKNYSKMMADILYKATEYMNAGDATIARGGKPKKRERQDNPVPTKEESIPEQEIEGTIGDQDLHLGGLSTSHP